MAAPTPPVPIVGGCSVIVNNTLYVYSPAAFQALPLQSGGTWTQLPNGVPVSGAACVRGSINGTNSGEALWVVGGANNASHPNYSGLQKYTFANNSWQTISPIAKVTQNRQNHAAVFLNNSASILVYAGSQVDVTVASSETFLISTVPPYSVSAYTSKNYPALSPIMLPWSNDSAITLGGDNQVRAIYHFDPKHGWRDLGTSITFDLNSTQSEQGLLVDGADSSKVLELYDLHATPNVVSMVVLQEANGKIAQPGQIIGAAPSRKRKRQTLNDWPTYNSTYAPSTSRTGFSLAQAPDGLVAITGGDSRNPVALFNQQENAWIDPGEFFGSSTSTTSPSSSASSSTSSSATSSATSSPTSSAVAVPVSNNNNNHSHTSLILGATLGSILGFIALLIILLLLIRWRRRRRRTSRESTSSEEKGRLSFADRGAPFMKEAGGAVNNPTNDMFGDDSARSRTRTLTSQSSSAPLVPGGRITPGASEVPGLSPVKEKSSPSKRSDANRPFARGERGVPSIIIETDSNRNSANSAQAAGEKRGSGWSGYFFGEKPNRSTGPTPRNSTYDPPVLDQSRGGTFLNYDNLRPDGSASHDCSTHGPTQIPPLALGKTFDTTRVSHVVTGVTATAVEAPRRAPSSRSAGDRTMASSRPSTDAPSMVTDTAYTAPTSEWTPVTRADFSTPPKLRDNRSSSFYGENSEVNPGLIASPRPALLSQSPGAGLRKSDGSLWGEPGPILGEDDNVGPDTPTPKNRIGLAKTTPGEEALIMGRQGVNSDMSWLKIEGS